jgi:hypothetical protein
MTIIDLLAERARRLGLKIVHHDDDESRRTAARQASPAIDTKPDVVLLRNGCAIPRELYDPAINGPVKE